MHRDGGGGRPGSGEAAAVSQVDLLYQGFLSVAEFRDPETGAHLERIAIFSRLLAEEAARRPGYPQAANQAWRETLFRAAPLHDIGKIAIPDRILLKPGKLTPSEFEVMKAHSTYGKVLLEGMSQRFGQQAPALLSMGATVAAHHHERWDGSGYPDGLAAEETPLEARVVALADVYDAVTSPRVYRPHRFSHRQAVTLIEANRGAMFAPGLTDAFLAIQEAIGREAARLADPPLAPRPPQPEARPAASGRVLVVDDEPVIRDLLGECLQGERFEVKTAGSVPEARMLLARQTFDLVTLDINMPGESGLALLDELAPRRPETTTLLMTALADVRVGVEALKKGAYDYLVKPIDLDEFLTAVRRALQHRELELEHRAYLTRLELTVAHQSGEMNDQLEAVKRELVRLYRAPKPC
ncbi:MAG: response regulator [Chloroflexi bacterium]|nr:response regulator [Chloroflexota bacterium]